MSYPDFERVREVFLEARALSPNGKKAYLDRTCGSDVHLRNEVEELLAADQDSTLAAPVFAAPAALPAKIGPYTILSNIGNGGMGSVYRGELKTPVFRVAAIKVVKLGLDSASILDRFKSESQALAMMSHPNIATFYGSGMTNSGQPYFAMEYVPGQPITHFADHHKMTISQRLRLFVQACEAIGHAHGKLIIHRDIKASNVLAYIQDDKPAAKVIDFGIAKALTGDPLGGRALQTVIGVVVGTYDYMSPEQAAGSADLDTRTDVYSLGVLLYELLAGALPFDRKTLGNSSEQEVRRMIQEVEPPRPSAHLSDLGDEATRIAEVRQAGVGILVRQLRSELEWIPLKAMRKSRDRRYASALELAKDIGNYLENLPLIAGPESNSYKLRKFLAKRKVPVLAIAAVIVALLTAIVGTTIGFVGQRRLTLQADEQRRQAVTAREDLQANQQALVNARDSAEYQAYVANIAAADASLNSAESYETSRYLAACPASYRNWEWRYLSARCDSSLLAWAGHKGRIKSVAYSPDGTRIATTGADDRTVRVWDSSTGKQLLVLRGHHGTVDCVAYSNDGSRIISSSGNWKNDTDKTARVWDANTGKQLLVLRGHEGSVGSARFSPDGTRIVTASYDKTARIWDATTGKLLKTLTGHTDWVLDAVLSPDGSRIVTAAWDNTARIWDSRTGKQLFVLEGHEGNLFSTDFSPDGAQVVTSSSDRTARIWDVASGKQLLVLSGHANNVYSASYSHDGSQIVTGSGDHTIRVWDSATGRQISITNVGRSDSFDAKFSPDGSRIATVSSDGMVRIFNPESERSYPILHGEDGDWLNGAAFSNDNRWIATASASIWNIWDASTGKRAVAPHECPSAVRGIAFDHKGKSVVTALEDHTARVWDAATGNQQLVLRGHDDIVTCAVFSPDDSKIATASYDNTARVWDRITGKELLVLRGHTGNINWVAFSPDGKQIVTASANLRDLTLSDHTARVWDAVTGAELLVLQGHTGCVVTANFNYQGTQIITASSDSTARIWDAHSGKQLQVLRGYGWVSGAAFSPDGTRVVTGENDLTARVWDPRTGVLLLVLRGHSHDVQSVAFSPDGTRILTASTDNTARVWDSLPRQQRYRAQLPTTAPAQSASAPATAPAY